MTAAEPELNLWSGAVRESPACVGALRCRHSRQALPALSYPGYTSNLRLVEAPGNVLVSAGLSGLPKDSVANVSQIVTIDRRILLEPVGRLDARTVRQVEGGLGLVLEL